MFFEELLKKVKEQARAKKWDADVSRGDAAISVGHNNAECPGLPHFGHEEQLITDINALHRNCPKWKKQG